MEWNDNQKPSEDLQKDLPPVNETIETIPAVDIQSIDRERSQTLRFAGFWMRFWAYILDLIVVGSIERLLVKPLFRLIDVPLAEFNMFAPISIASAVVFYLYFVLMTKYFNQTIGKMVFGLKVIDLKGETLSWSTILFREWIGRFISATVVLGYIIVAFLPKKQGLHDLFTETSVIHVER
jgi:uncharacterized RDD family membrane protein YckC